MASVANARFHLAARKTGQRVLAAVMPLSARSSSASARVPLPGSPTATRRPFTSASVDSVVPRRWKTHSGSKKTLPRAVSPVAPDGGRGAALHEAHVGLVRRQARKRLHRAGAGHDLEREALLRQRTGVLPRELDVGAVGAPGGHHEPPGRQRPREPVGHRHAQGERTHDRERHERRRPRAAGHAARGGKPGEHHAFSRPENRAARDATFVGGPPGAPGQACSGPVTVTVKWKVAPPLGLPVAHRRPPWASTIERAIDSPMPMPSAFVV